MSPGLQGSAEAGRGQTEPLRRKGQSSFNVLMRGAQMPRGSEALFVPLASQGWLGSLCLAGCYCRLGDTVLSQRGLSSTDSLTDLGTLAGSERLREIPGWGDRLTTGGL